MGFAFIDFRYQLLHTSFHYECNTLNMAKLAYFSLWQGLGVVVGSYDPLQLVRNLYFVHVGSSGIRLVDKNVRY